MTRPHVLLLCMDPGIQWESKKGASVHLRSMAAAFEEAGAKISVLTHDGVSTGVGGDRTFDRLGDIDAMHRYFHAFRSRSGYEMRAVASNSLYVEHARRLHMQQPVDIIYERFSLWSDVGARLAGELNAPSSSRSTHRSCGSRRPTESSPFTISSPRWSKTRFRPPIGSSS